MVRGVKADRAMTSLLNRSLIREVGRKETLGHPVLYGTTSEFLKSFGLSSLDELPALGSRGEPSGEVS
jgi:segregation and condensation protein B